MDLIIFWKLANSKLIATVKFRGAVYVGGEGGGKGQITYSSPCGSMQCCIVVRTCWGIKKERNTFGKKWVLWHPPRRDWREIQYVYGCKGLSIFYGWVAQNVKWRLSDSLKHLFFLLFFPALSIYCKLEVLIFDVAAVGIFFNSPGARQSWRAFIKIKNLKPVLIL